MSLLKINDIKEEIQNKQKEYDDEIMVGIDLGTSNSVVSYYDESLKKIKIITIENSNLVPSIVAYTQNGVVVGQNAKNESNGVVLKSIKRLIGKSMEQIDTNYLGFDVGTSENNDSITVNVGDRFVSVEEVVSEILSFLKNKAKQELKKEIKKAVISVPAYFDEVQRNATKNAASIANLEVVRLINEPTAAALAYGLDNDIEGVYLVYDLGGGTFDVSILQMQRGIFKVLSTNGDTHLGGDDIDNLIFNDIMNEMGFNYGDLSNGENSYLRSIAKKIKEDLSNQNEVNEMISLQSKSINFQLSRKKLEGMIAKLVEKTIDICKIAIDDSKINISNIAGVILVGGATRIPIIKEIIAREFNTKILCDINPDEVVSMGAGHSAASLSGLSDDALLLDVLPLSLGIEIAGGIVEKIIHRNTLLPIAKAQEFTTSVDNQTSILIHVLQGERELVDDLRSLGKFSLKGIPKMPAGLPRIKVVFSLDADGILTVSAQEEITGINQKIELKPTWGLSFLEMREIIENSYNHSQEDIVKRLEIQSKIEAKQLISSIQKALAEDKDLLSQQDYDNINNHLNDLIQMLDIKGIKEDIDNKMKLLEDLTNTFAQIRMDKKIKNILKGEDIKELEEKI